MRGKNMEKKFVIFGIITMVGILILAGCTGTTKNGSNTNTNTNTNTQPQQNDTEARIPLSDLSTTAQFYSYDDNGVTIRYFAVKDSQGSAHVAFDACDVCYEAKKGYKQVGSEMQCLNCGRQFSISSIGTENTAGGCWPSYLSMTIDGNDIVIKISDLQDKSFMF
jgi:uncharacterized membrane protein